jgi:SAM-dependent methyltransferase
MKKATQNGGRLPESSRERLILDLLGLPSCEYPPGKLPPPSTGRLTTRQAAEVLSAARQHGFETVLFVSAPPHLRADLPALQQVAGAKDLTTGLWPVGWSTKELADFVADNKPGFVELHGLVGADWPALLERAVTLSAAGTTVELVGRCSSLATSEVGRSLTTLQTTLTNMVNLTLYCAKIALSAFPLGVRWWGVPWCLVPEEGRIFLASAETGHSPLLLRDLREGLVPVVRPTGTPAQPCLGCADAAACGGPPGVVEAGEACRLLRPRAQVRSNSFNFLVGASFEREDESCPVLTGRLDVDANRDLLVLDRGAFTHARTDTADFSASEIRTIRDELGQVYLDVSAKSLLDDFPQDVRQLRLWAGCDDCPRFETCGHAFVPVEEDVFGRDERERVLPVLEKIGGDVLDVGCGGMRYRSLLERKLADGAVRYQAVEPHANEALRRYLADRGTLHEMPIEQFAASSGTFDWVLFLRSYNHFPELSTALHKAAKLLRPGGHLLIVENTVFGLVRRPEQVPCREYGPESAWEHYRNHASAQARVWTTAWGFETLIEHPLGPGTSNQWLLLCRKRETVPL